MGSIQAEGLVNSVYHRTRVIHGLTGKSNRKVGRSILARARKGKVV